MEGSSVIIDIIYLSCFKYIVEIEWMGGKFKFEGCLVVINGFV